MNNIDWSNMTKLGLLGCAAVILSFLIFVSGARNADAFSCWMPGMDFSDGRIKPVGEIPSGAEGSCSAEGVSNLDEAETECYNAADSAYLVREQNCYFRPDLLKAGVVARHGTSGTLSRWCSVPIACRYPSWHEKTGATTGESADWRLKQDYHKLTWCLDGSHSQKGDCIAMPVTESEWANNVGVAILQTALKAKSAYTHKAHVYRWDNFLDLMVARKRSEARSYASQWAGKGLGTLGQGAWSAGGLLT